MEGYMNPPKPNGGQAYVEHDFRTGMDWACCPECGKRALMLLPETRIRGLPFRCRNSKCKFDFMVNVDYK